MPESFSSSSELVLPALAQSDEVSHEPSSELVLPESFSSLVLPALDHSDEVFHESVVNPVPVGQSVDVSSPSPDKMNQSPVFAAEAIFDFLAPSKYSHAMLCLGSSILNQSVLNQFCLTSILNRICLESILNQIVVLVVLLMQVQLDEVQFMERILCLRHWLVDILIYVISSLACEYFGMFLPPYLFQWN
jgi:hypothetical protein